MAWNVAISVFSASPILKLRHLDKRLMIRRPPE
jgi:hypothetical protein